MKALTVMTAAALASLSVAACDHPSTKAGAAANSTAGVVASAPAPSKPVVTMTSDSSSPNAPVSSATTAMSTAATGANSANAVSDTMVSGKVKTAITADSGMKDADVSVKTENGVVTLTGTAKSQAQVTLAAALAQRQEGVSRVENQVTVK